MTVYAVSMEQLDQWVRWYQRQGYGLTEYRNNWARLVRPKRLSAGWLIFWIAFGWLFLWLPLIVYLVLFALAADLVVGIAVLSPEAKSGDVVEVRP